MDIKTEKDVEKGDLARSKSQEWRVYEPVIYIPQPGVDVLELIDVTAPCTERIAVYEKIAFHIAALVVENITCRSL